MNNNVKLHLNQRPHNPSFVYAIECDDGSHYVGQSEDLPRRWEEHLGGRAAEWTAQHKPLRVVHYEEYGTREKAVERVIQRGNRRQETFFCKNDYQVYIGLMAEWCTRSKVAI